MAGKVQIKRDALRAKLIEIGHDRIAAGGSQALKARELAKEAGCSVGAIYNLFDDLSDLALVVNLDTFQRMGLHVSAAVKESGTTDPTDQLSVMARAYLDFAALNSGIWRHLFDLGDVEEAKIPDWYWTEMANIFGLIEDPLSRLNPDRSLDEIKKTTRILFSSVHGIILLGLEGSIFAVPRPDLEAMIQAVVEQFTKK